jgi:hypothetical protein
MAIALEEIAAGVVESAVGPWALLFGAGAVAVAFAAGSTRPLSRMVTASVIAVDASGRVDPRQWFRSLRGGVRSLVNEAWAEYEAGRRRPGLSPDGAADIVADAAPSSWPAGGGLLLATEASFDSDVADSAKRRDARGRFVPRSPNGAAQA